MSVEPQTSSEALSLQLAELNLSQVIQQPNARQESGGPSPAGEATSDEIEQDDESLQLLLKQNQAALSQNAKLLVREDFDALGGPTEAWWTMGVHVIPEHIIGDVDDNVLALMPEGTEIISIDPHGNSTWSRTAEIQTELNGELISYFIKTTDYRSGKVMYRSEFESLKAMHGALPGICPQPIAWGQYASEPSVYFLLCHFLDIFNEPADPDLLPPRMAELHQRALSPDGLYGWHVPMAGGQLPVMVAKSASWEDFFTRYMRYIFRAEEVAQGPRPPEIERLTTLLFNRIIPRLLRPLETGGRTIVPRLLHTDLWDGNLGADNDGSAIIFDPMSMYGHNEFDLGVWNNPRQKLGTKFINNYHKFFPISAPEDDHYGRNVLYTLAFEVRVAATKVGNPLYRNEMIRYMTDLESKYPESYEEWAKARSERVFPAKVDSGLRWP
ncbi:Fructosamine kinase-domain-containing protein [Xylariaceae sp. FL1272]|nr:Fructosamine kinase-domain-containing protein [Xylariaceae sp. FL1272]